MTVNVLDVLRKVISRFMCSMLSLMLLFMSTKLAVAAQHAKPVALQIAAAENSLREGESTQLSVWVKFADGSKEEVTSARYGTYYETAGAFTDKPIVTVSESGVVTAHAIGEQWSASVTVLVVNQQYNLAGYTTFTVRRESALEVHAEKTTLRVGETIQLKVIRKSVDGSVQDVTDASAGTIYSTTAESMLIPEPDGSVTCIGTRGESKEIATIGVHNGDFYDAIRFTLLPGPGPSLQVVVEDSVLKEGEQTELRIYISQKNGTDREISAARPGTNYQVFPRDQMVRVTDDGRVVAADSIAPYDSVHAVVFVRHGGHVGWARIEVWPAAN